MCTYILKNYYLSIENMTDLGLPQYYDTLELERTQTKIEIVQQKTSDETKNYFPENVKKAVNEIIRSDSLKEQEKLENDYKIEAVFKKLENEPWTDFNRADFNLELLPLTSEEKKYLWYELFILSKKLWDKLSYVNSYWEKIVDLTKEHVYYFEDLLISKDWWENLFTNESWQLFYKLEDWKIIELKLQPF